MTSGVYVIRNTANLSCYIGRAVSFENRVYLHFWSLRRGDHHSQHLQRAFDKYGEDVFEAQLLEECGKTELKMVEQWWIDNAKPEYNCSKSAEGGSESGWTPANINRRGKPLSEAHRKKLSEATKGRAIPESRKKAISIGRTGTKVSEEGRRNISASQMGKKLSEAHKAAISAAFARKRELRALETSQCQTST